MFNVWGSIKKIVCFCAEAACLGSWRLSAYLIKSLTHAKTLLRYHCDLTPYVLKHDQLPHETKLGYVKFGLSNMLFLYIRLILDCLTFVFMIKLMQLLPIQCEDAFPYTQPVTWACYHKLFGLKLVNSCAPKPICLNVKACVLNKIWPLVVKLARSNLLRFSLFVICRVEFKLFRVWVRFYGPLSSWKAILSPPFISFVKWACEMAFIVTTTWMDKNVCNMSE